MSFAHGIKIIREKTFCFDVRLIHAQVHAYNTYTWGKAAESRGIRMSKSPPLLLRNWAMMGLLSQNLFCQFQAKGEWLTILESLKKKNKQRCSYELKMIYICGVNLGLLPQTSLCGLRLLSSPSLYLPILMRLLPWGDLGLYLYLFYRACMCKCRQQTEGRERDHGNDTNKLGDLSRNPHGWPLFFSTLHQPRPIFRRGV